jgi:hypothetical protein
MSDKNNRKLAEWTGLSESEAAMAEDQEVNFMTPDDIAQLSRAIAEHCEPEPKAISGRDYSADGYWHRAGNAEFKPVLCTDPCIAMALLERLLQHDPTTAIAIRPRFSYSYQDRNGPLMPLVPCSVVQGPDMAQAIAFAFAKVNGLLAGLQWE